MRYLLDTHVLIWWITDDRRLSRRGGELIQNRRNEIFWSAASSWELAVKHALGRLVFEDPPEVLIPMELEKNRIETIPILNEHAFLAGRLPPHHKDPFDRMIVAQARIESMGLITSDSALASYDIEIFW